MTARKKKIINILANIQDDEFTGGWNEICSVYNIVNNKIYARIIMASAYINIRKMNFLNGKCFSEKYKKEIYEIFKELRNEEIYFFDLEKKFPKIKEESINSLDKSIVSHIYSRNNDDQSIGLLSKYSLAEGLGNLGINLYGNLRDKQKYCILEKETKQKNEIYFHERILNDRIFECQSVVPKTYFIASDKGSAKIYMEYIDGDFASSNFNVEVLANTIFESINNFNKLSSIKYGKSDISKIYSDGFSKSRNIKILEDEFGLDVSSFYWIDESKEFLNLPIVFSHNDLHLKNIIIKKEREKLFCKFIDFALVGPNIIGVELHAFLRNSGDSVFERDIYEALLRRYKSKYPEVNFDNVKKAILNFSVRRLVNRIVFDLNSNDLNACHSRIKTLNYLNSLI
ncbi:hypothetical protein [Comamonas kerstersii]|uniref:hypothetical protein n=1 Tax=Comamonas kerstersii TaxID=225992 RepID=UPI0013B04DF7|nr:hypothetical protein [Comamonas kerstersii]